MWVVAERLFNLIQFTGRMQLRTIITLVPLRYFNFENELNHWQIWCSLFFKYVQTDSVVIKLYVFNSV